MFDLPRRIVHTVRTIRVVLWMLSHPSASIPVVEEAHECPQCALRGGYACEDHEDDLDDLVARIEEDIR